MSLKINVLDSHLDFFFLKTLAPSVMSMGDASLRYSQHKKAIPEQVEPKGTG
jgi:hypothetical protein